MKISTIDSKSLAEYLYHNLLMCGYPPDYDELLLIADMIIDYLMMASKDDTYFH